MVPELLPQAVIIPDLSWRTASLFKVPIPPPLNIAITPLKLEGTVDLATGQMELQFDANFVFSAGPLLVGTATVDKTGDLFLDNFLLLPTDALAIMVMVRRG
ncbi:uncharacterized protein HaLaN_25727 [Haematococcus lacustris]|uniref:Uncharacterized protein n=1 Tax=Haematococcus lacustris TaxID=44745 RepID=A0A6A0A0K0_HAELA|nr:uncharacterized protein HaLaN_25727 [Haematococcus lacustris]